MAKQQAAAQFKLLREFIVRHTADNALRLTYLGALESLNYGWERCNAMIGTLTNGVQNSPFKMLGEQGGMVLVAISKELYQDLTAPSVEVPPTGDSASSSVQTTES